MKLLAVIVTFGFVIAANAIDLKIVKEDIVPNCLNRLYDPRRPMTTSLRPVANSMENFISLVEKIERNHTTWDIYKVSRILLNRFGFNGIVFEEGTGERLPVQENQYSHYKTRDDIISKLLPPKSGEEVFDEKDLSEEEKCSMFLMLGHLVNDTYIEGDDEELVEFNYNVDTHNAPGQNVGPRSKMAKLPREQGVVSLNGNPHHAIALRKVLLGIVTSPRINENVDIGTMFGYLRDQLENFNTANKINPLLGVTLGDVVAHAALSKGHNEAPYGIGGNWNNTACTEVYRMNQHTMGSTRALVFGAIDGLLIGKRLQSLNGNTRTMTLSKVLRMYYSRLGIPVDNSGTATSYCRRGDFRAIIGENNLVESIASFYYVYYAMDKNNVDENSDQKARENLQQLETMVGSNIGINYEFCTPQSSDQTRCETRANIFVVLDDSEARSRGFTLQEETIGHLSNNFDISYGGSTLSIFFNSRGGNNNLRDVSLFSYNATNQAAATCSASRIDMNLVGQSMDEENLMHALNGTLQDFENKVTEESYAPAKAVVIFKYGELVAKDMKKLERAAGIVKYGHRDTRVFTVGNNADTLKYLSTDIKDVITGLEDPKQIAKRLATMICEVPSVLQYEDCWNRRSRNEQNNVHIGYVTPDHVQYVAMYPQYFLKSGKIQFKFNVDGAAGDITVCFSRYDVTPKEGEKGSECRTTGVDGIRDLTFHMNDPCHKYAVYNCPPAYFSITGKKKSTDRNRCNEENCRRMDQIKYIFSHEGIYCSGSLSLLSSPVSVFILITGVLSKFVNIW